MPSVVYLDMPFNVHIDEKWQRGEALIDPIMCK